MWDRWSVTYVLTAPRTSKLRVSKMWNCGKRCKKSGYVSSLSAFSSWESGVERWHFIYGLAQQPEGKCELSLRGEARKEEPVKLFALSACVQHRSALSMHFNLRASLQSLMPSDRQLADSAKALLQRLLCWCVVVATPATTLPQQHPKTPLSHRRISRSSITPPHLSLPTISRTRIGSQSILPHPLPKLPSKTSFNSLPPSPTSSPFSSCKSPLVPRCKLLNFLLIFPTTPSNRAISSSSFLTVAALASSSRVRPPAAVRAMLVQRVHFAPLKPGWRISRLGQVDGRQLCEGEARVRWVVEGWWQMNQGIEVDGDDDDDGEFFWVSSFWAA